MLWLIQEKLFIENRRNDLLDALRRLDIPFQMVQVTKDGISSNHLIDDTTPIITNGSVRLSQIARERGWSPGSFFNENFSYEVWAPHYTDLLLNKNATISTVGNAKVTTDRIFARPLLDTKAFNGRVFTQEEFTQLQSKAKIWAPGSLSPDTRILLAPPKTIGQEHRHYIVDGEVVTSSRYKLAGKPNFTEGADSAIIEFVKDAAKIWQPARAFVLDTYIAGSEIGIVEIGCICHAGLYQSDLIKLVHALDSMPFGVQPAPQRSALSFIKS